MLLYAASLDDGIHAAHFAPETGELSEARKVAGGEFVFLARHPVKRVLYAVSREPGQVKAFAMEPGGGLSLLSEVRSGGDVPCHLVVDPEGKFLAVANYRGGVVRFPLGEDGRLAEASATFQPEGSGPDPKRQSQPHPHGLAFDPGHPRLRVADLGTDKILALDTSGGGLVENAPLAACVSPGAGPRHLAFAPGGAVAVAVNEMGNTLSLFTRNPETGALENRRDFPTLPEDFRGTSHAGEVVFHPAGRACHATNRGEDSVVTYAVDEAALALRSPHWLREPGLRNPEHAVFDPGGKWLAVAWRSSDRVTLHPVNPQTFHPGPSRGALAVSKPMCALFVEK